MERRVNFEELQSLLTRVSTEDLARIVFYLSAYNPVVRRVALLHASFLKLKDKNLLTEVVVNAATVEDFIPYDECGSYGIILYEILELLKKLVEQGQPDLAHHLALEVIKVAEKSTENLDDGFSWVSSIGSLERFAGDLRI